MALISPAPSSRPRLLVCFDLREHIIDVRKGLQLDPFVINCRRILTHARENGWVVVHVHRREPAPRGPAPSVHGLEPLPTEPIFTQSGLSAFSNRAFRDLAGRYLKGEMIIIGCSAASSCLATALAAYDQDMDVVMIEDAVVATPLETQGLEAIGALTQAVDAPFVSFLRTSDLLGLQRRLELVYSQ
jgi:nicotinamidase-related amidase